MILLLDAHTLKWWLEDAATLASGARDAIRDPGNDVLVSAASVWELEIKAASGKLRIDADLIGAIGASGFMGVPISLEDAHAAAALPLHHRDPFDRMLVAQAHRLEAVIVSRDRAFEPYDIHQLLA